MNKNVIAAVITTAAAATLSFAATTNYDIGLGTLAAGKTQFSQPHGTGSNPFGYDWDSAKPVGVAGGPTGFADGAFYASVAQAGATQPDRYRTFRLGTRDLAGVPGGTLQIGELSSITYQTNKPGAQSAIDWRLSIYTTPQGAGDITWYRNRIQAAPSGSLNLSAPSDQWNTWSTVDSATNQLQFSVNRSGFTAADIDWSEVTTGAVVRGANSWDFSGEEIMMLDFTLGANSGGGTGESSLDAITLNFSNGESVVVNLVPEPASLGLLGLAGMIIGRRRR